MAHPIFIPMEKPAAIRVPPAPIRARDRIGMDLVREDVQDKNLEYDVDALAHLLLLCPATIETMIEHWMAHDRDTERDPGDSLTRLLQTLGNLRPILQIASRPVVSELGRRDGYDNSIALFVNYQREHGRHDYEVSDRILASVAAPLADACPELYTMRLKVLLTGLMVYRSGRLFDESVLNASNTTQLFARFTYDRHLAAHYDCSTFLLALIAFILRACRSLNATESTEASWTMPEPALYMHWDDLTREEAAATLYQVLDEFVAMIRSRVNVIQSATVNIPEDLCVYKPEETSPQYLFGIPLQVVERDTYTLLWLEWAWKSDHASSTAATLEERNAQRAVGLQRLVDDLWRAKSLLLWHNYYEFFELWDETRLAPFLQRFESS